MKSPVLLALASAAVVAAPVAQARVTKVEYSTPAIAFGGYVWPGVGRYVKITGTATAEVDPGDPRNAMIVDLTLAQPQPANQPTAPGRNSSGKVVYQFNFYILKPENLAAVDRTLNGYSKVMYEPPNRGNKTWTALGRVTGGGNDPATITDTTVLANSFLMPRGYTLVWSGWEPLAALTSLTQTAALPIAKNSDGSTITGPAYEYIVTGNSSFTLAYAAATLDKSRATLTHRVHLTDKPTVVPSDQWNYNAAGTAISLVSGNFTANDIYEFSYTARDPWVAGLGFAAVRDWNSFIKYETADDAGTANPLANYITRIYTEISSQPGRLLNDFRHLGFNEDERGRKVLDGHMQWIAAGSGIGMNYRFSQSGRTERNRQDHLYAENLFPFANVPTTDPFTGKTDSRYAKCEQTGTCPLGVEIYSANEYWVKSASLLHTAPDGSRDLPDSPYSRDYFISSHMHGSSGFPPTQGSCQQLTNPLNSAPIQRALFLALDKWATTGTPAPATRVPRLSDGTLVLPANTGFPTNIPDKLGASPTGMVTYTGLKSTRYRFDYGPGFYDTGIPSIFPPVIHADPTDSNKLIYQFDPATPLVSVNGPVYPSFVPKTDSDGNDIAGVRLPDVTVPLATYTGWALRRAPQTNDGCEGSGQFIPFAADSGSRGADPRPSIGERYASFQDYDNKIVAAIDAMVSDRLMLCEDATSERARLRDRWVALAPSTKPATPLTPHSFPLASITSVTASPSSLWPPNGKMTEVSVQAAPADNCNASCRITQISGTDGASSADWQITGNLTAALRADRSGKAKDGRTYTLTLNCSDDAGMSTTKNVAVTVPHDQGK